MFYGIKVWRLARPLHGLNVLLLEPLLFLPCPCVLGHCPAGIPIHDPSSVFWLREGGSHLIFDGTVYGPVHWPLNAVKTSCTLSRETASKQEVSTSVFDCRDGVLGVIVSISLLPNTRSRVDVKELNFCLIWPQQILPSLL